MTLNNISKKLKKNNKAQYRQFQFCIGFSMMLISSYLLMLYSPLIQKTLPEGGDSRTQIMMIFSIAAAGCIIFVMYATGLFLRFKSREIGVFLALGTQKDKIKMVFIKDIFICTLQSILMGMLTGGVLAFLLGKIFEQITKNTVISTFSYTASGIIFSVVYALILFLTIVLQALKFLKTTNIMDVLNEHRKQEPINNAVTMRYLYSGIVMIIIGLLVGFIVPSIVAEVFYHLLGMWTNVFYLLVILGLYRIMVYSISCHKKGKNPQKYYNNLITYGLLKFQGRSIVRNMLVVTLLIIAGLFSAFYVPTNNYSTKEGLKHYENMYSFFYTADADELTKEDIFFLAEQYNIDILNYREGTFLQVVGSGVNREDLDENRNVTEIYEEKYGVYECISASQYEELTGEKVFIEDGTYKMIQKPKQIAGFRNEFDDMDQLYLDLVDSYLPMNYVGNVEYQSLLNGDWGFGRRSRFVISDYDYERVKRNTAQYPAVTQVLFDSSEGAATLQFANELYKEFALRISNTMKVCAGYDMYQKSINGDEYGYDNRVMYDPENPVKETDWQYEPNFLILKENNRIMTFAVYFLLFSYVSVICLSAVSIVAYSRSQSVGLSCNMVFRDLEKLGANHSYLRKLLKNQIQKIYVLPTLIGSISMIGFEALILKMNDGLFTKEEAGLFPVFISIAVVFALVQYVMYRFSIKKVGKAIGI